MQIRGTGQNHYQPHSCLPEVTPQHTVQWGVGRGTTEPLPLSHATGQPVSCLHNAWEQRGLMQSHAVHVQGGPSVDILRNMNTT